MNNARGYSLLEVMISMVVLGIAFLALIATQLGTLNGYVSARDELQAAELGRRTAELFRIQGSQWIYNMDHDADGSTPDTFDSNPTYGSAQQPLDVNDPLGAILGANLNWVALVNRPVDARFNRADATISVDHLGGKHCIYARGGPVSTFQAFDGGADVTAAIRTQIAVVYPGPRAVLTDCTLGASITAVELDDVGNPLADPFAPPALEGRGYRVSYYGTVVVRRAHLTQFAGGAP